ncbi:MAG: CDP-alcohol phosphatidyltransferase family protein [Thermoplasmata archaeon]
MNPSSTNSNTNENLENSGIVQNMNLNKDVQDVFAFENEYKKIGETAGEYVPVTKLISAADVATIGNACVGLLSILYALNKNFTISVSLILFAMALDSLDGALARKFGSRHSFGGHLDSISDTVSFCFAPAVLLYAAYYDATVNQPYLNRLLVVTMGSVVILGAVRLAWFAHIRGGKLDYFKGLNTPLMSLMIVSTYLTFPENIPPAVLLIVFLLSLCMVIAIKFPKIRGALIIPTGAMVAILLFSTLFFRNSPWFFIAPVISLAGVALYIIVGPFYVRHELGKKQRG